MKLKMIAAVLICLFVSGFTGTVFADGIRLNITFIDDDGPDDKHMRDKKSPPPAQRKDSLQLIRAVNKNDLQSVRRLVSGKVDVNGSDREGRTAIFYAAAKGNTEILRFLINNRARINIHDNDGATPLMFAAYAGHYSCVKQLKDSGADITARDRHARTAYDYASASDKRIRDLLRPSKKHPQKKDKRR
ncbi:MAG: ankyrin repeat domain-containing protein [Endomicrobium sp.]|jgi:ankyrin repeat protein|nr:ankyrin repeat domain-containing protein [Endomicrobium sp.]